MIKIFKKINLIFIDILLFFFYFLVLGFAKIIYVTTKKVHSSEHTHWKKPDKKSLDVYSPY